MFSASSFALVAYLERMDYYTREIPLCQHFFKSFFDFFEKTFETWCFPAKSASQTRIFFHLVPQFIRKTPCFSPIPTVSRK